MFCDSESEVVAGVVRDGLIFIVTNAGLVLCARHGGGTMEGPGVREM
jgi:hypothetical protein